MGRVNFDKSIHDRKGITKKVEVVNGDQVQELKGWTVYNLPPFYEFVSQKNYQAGKPVDGPAYYKATFHLDKTGDTFLDMQTWGKGMVWVNGHAMGRFWEIGPQQTLYMPGCWLKEGDNEIIVLDLKGPAEAKVVGVEKPILDMLREKAPETHRKDGQNLNLKAEKPVMTGTFKAGNGWQEVRFENRQPDAISAWKAFPTMTVPTLPLWPKWMCWVRTGNRFLVKTGRLFMPTAKKPAAETVPPTRCSTCRKVPSGRQ